jgi:hypothetical protein
VIGIATDKLIATLGPANPAGESMITCTIKIPEFIPNFRLKTIYWKYTTDIDSGVRAVISGSVSATGGSVSDHNCFRCHSRPQCVYV